MSAYAAEYAAFSFAYPALASWRGTLPARENGIRDLPVPVDSDFPRKKAPQRRPIAALV